MINTDRAECCPKCGNKYTINHDSENTCFFVYNVLSYNNINLGDEAMISQCGVCGHKFVYVDFNKIEEEIEYL